MSRWNPIGLVGYFARGAPVCVIARQDQNKYTRLIHWDTETDVFTPGQWFRGYIWVASLTPDGKYMAAGITGGRVRRLDDGSREGGDISVICRPPYITALEVWLGEGMLVGFKDDEILMEATPNERHKVHAQSPCPFSRREGVADLPDPWRIVSETNDSQKLDQHGRHILFHDGCVYVEKRGKHLLYDTNPMRFEPIEAPDWAKDW